MGMMQDGPLRKFYRAERHRDELDQLMSEWVETDPIAIVKDGDTDFGTHRWLFRRAGEAHPDMGLVFGDMVHNLRSVLDHIVCALVTIQGEEPTQWNGFPIETDPTRFWNRRRDLKRDPLRFVEDKWAEEVARWQPFATYCGAPGDDPLTILALLDNTDKHRNLLVTLAAVHTAHFTGSVRTGDTPTTIHLDWPRRAVREDGEVALTLWTEPPTAIEVDLKEQTQFHLQIAVDVVDGPLPSLFGPVYDIIDAFMPAFP